MPKGIYPRKPRIPKQYPAELVKSVREKYSTGMTQHEIAQALNTTSKVVCRLMKHHGIKARTAAKRHQSGQENHMWKGDAATYTALHFRVEKAFGKPKCCEICGINDETKRYEWANMTGKYNDIHDYKRMCKSCHHKYDERRRKETGRNTCVRFPDRSNS